MKIRDAEEKKREALIDRNCPSGHIALTNEERLEALSMAQKSKRKEKRDHFKIK